MVRLMPHISPPVVRLSKHLSSLTPATPSSTRAIYRGVTGAVSSFPSHDIAGSNLASVYEDTETDPDSRLDPTATDVSGRDTREFPVL